jgi:hypothetical protein
MTTTVLPPSRSDRTHAAGSSWAPQPDRPAVYERQGTWWGEDDDMIFVDDDTWPPSLHGTGTEDYLTHAWGMQKNSALYGGSILHASDLENYSAGYRFQ